MKKGNPTVRIVLGVILFFMFAIFLYNIYCIFYCIGKETEFAYISDYMAFINEEDNMEPDYNKDDLLIIKKEDFYSTGQIVLYKNNEAYRVGEIAKSATSKYYVVDNMNENKEIEVDKQYVYGSVNKNIGSFGGLFRIVTSTAFTIITVILTFIYVMFSKEGQ